MVNLPTKKYISTAEQLANIVKQSGAKKIGLLGGSFNPPHEGHMKISELAHKLFGLDILVWLVTPQNPFKDISHRNNLAKRLEMSCEFVKNEPFYVIIDTTLDRLLYSISGMFVIMVIISINRYKNYILK